MVFVFPDWAYFAAIDTLGLIAIIYGIFIRPRLEAWAANKKFPRQGTYVEVSFWDLGVKTGNLPPINITKVYSNLGGLFEDFIKSLQGNKQVNWDVIGRELSKVMTKKQLEEVAETINKKLEA